MRGQKGYALKCESCGHEDTVFFHEMFDALKELSFKIRGKKCSKCGNRMKVDPSKHIDF